MGRVSKGKCSKGNIQSGATGAKWNVYTSRIRFALILINLVAPPTFFHLFQPASLALFLIRFNSVVGSLLSPLDLRSNTLKMFYCVTSY